MLMPLSQGHTQHIKTCFAHFSVIGGHFIEYILFSFVLGGVLKKNPHVYLPSITGKIKKWNRSYAL
jgi:hypothetical protein